MENEVEMNNLLGDANKHRTDAITTLTAQPPQNESNSQQQNLNEGTNGKDNPSAHYEDKTSIKDQVSVQTLQQLEGVQVVTNNPESARSFCF